MCANWLFDKGREGFLDGSIDWDTDNIKITLTDTTYDPTAGSETFLSQISTTDRVTTSGNLASKTVTSGVADAADVTMTTVTGNVIQSIVIYADSGTSTTSRLIAYIDSATGLPVTPNGGDITVQWDSGANRIFKL